MTAHQPPQCVHNQLIYHEIGLKGTCRECMDYDWEFNYKRCILKFRVLSFMMWFG